MKYAQEAPGKKLYLLLAVMLAAALVLTGCVKAGQEAEETVDPFEGAFHEAPEETLGTGLETPYITFYCPTDWEGKIESVAEENGADYSLTFKTRVSDRDVKLFAINMGSSAEGYLLGTLTHGAETVNVCSVVYEVKAEEWSEEDYAAICAMQEQVNELLSQLQNAEGFTPSR